MKTISRTKRQNPECFPARFYVYEVHSDGYSKVGPKTGFSSKRQANHYARLRALTTWTNRIWYVVLSNASIVAHHPSAASFHEMTVRLTDDLFSRRNGDIFDERPSAA